MRNPVVKAELEDLGLPDVLFPEPSPISFAQHAEDLIVEGILSTRYPNERPRSWTYLDIGANHPVHGSNTYLFYKKGASGVVIEPNQKFAPLFKKCRPRDQFILAGAKFDDRDTATFYEVENDALSSFSESFHFRWKEQGGRGANAISSLDMPLVDVNSVIEKNFQNKLHIVSLDVEGYEMQVLEKFSFDQIRPDVLIVEYISPSHGTLKDSLTIVMNKRGYYLAFCGRVNLIFLSEI